MYIGQSEKQRRKKMIAIFIAPFYIALNIYLFWRIKGWVQAYFPKLKGKKGWIVPIVLYAFLASALVIAFFLPQGRFRRGMKLVGNYWLGVLLYMIFFIVIAELGRFLLLHVFRVSKDKICVPRVRSTQDSGLCVRNTYHVYIILGSGKCETCAGDAL